MHHVINSMMVAVLIHLNALGILMHQASLRGKSGVRWTDFWEEEFVKVLLVASATRGSLCVHGILPLALAVVAVGPLVCAIEL